VRFAKIRLILPPQTTAGIESTLVQPAPESDAPERIYEKSTAQEIRVIRQWKHHWFDDLSAHVGVKSKKATFAGSKIRGKSHIK